MIIGLTGRVGSGKSQASHILKSRFSAEILDLDKIGHHCINQPTVTQKLVKTFGDILDSEGNVDRHTLRDIVLSNPDQMSLLNQIVHPAIKDTVLNALSQSTSLIVIEGALLVEIGLKDHCDLILVIDADDDAIQAKIGDRFRFSMYQMSRDEYKQIADIVIQNRFTSDFEDQIVQSILDHDSSLNPSNR